jgi:hypothetical protein
MTLTVDEARAAAAAAVEPLWGPSFGHMLAAFDIFEDHNGYMVEVAAEEWLIDKDPGFMLLDGPLVFVDKQTGKTEITSYLPSAARIDKMTPIVQPSNVTPK